jgi:hypothetical protein
VENVITRIQKWFGDKVAPSLKKLAGPENELTYLLSDDRRSIKCLKCGRTSYNKNDIRNLFCGLCGYHELPKA